MEKLTRKITLTGIFAALALAVFVIEAQLPPIAIPGVKLGLSNAVSLAAMIFISRKCAGAVTLIRITLGAVFCGTLMSFAFSAAGGILAFAVMAAVVEKIDRHQLWAVSVLGAIGHSIGQFLAAMIFIGTKGLLIYLPIMIICSVISGALTGLLVQRLWFSPLQKISMKKTQL